MAGTLLLKELSAAGVTITSAGSSVATGTASSAGVIDLRSGGTASLIEGMRAYAELTCQFTTITGITAGVIVADLYLVPSIDGTNYADVDTTSGSSFISSNYRRGNFIAHKQFVTATNYRMSTAEFDLFPSIYTAYVLFKAGQTVSANWTLKLLAAAAQY